MLFKKLLAQTDWQLTFKARGLAHFKIYAEETLPEFDWGHYEGLHDQGVMLKSHWLSDFQGQFFANYLQNLVRKSLVDLIITQHERHILTISAWCPLNDAEYSPILLHTKGSEGYVDQLFPGRMELHYTDPVISLIVTGLLSGISLGKEESIALETLLALVLGVPLHVTAKPTCWSPLDRVFIEASDAVSPGTPVNLPLKPTFPIIKNISLVEVESSEKVMDFAELKSLRQSHPPEQRSPEHWSQESLLGFLKYAFLSPHYPSAGGFYDEEVIFVNWTPTDHLTRGLYWLDRSQASLVLTDIDSKTLDEIKKYAVTSVPNGPTSAGCLLFVSRPQRLKTKYQPLALRLELLNAGVLLYQAQLTGAQHGIYLTPIGKKVPSWKFLDHFGEETYPVLMLVMSV